MILLSIALIQCVRASRARVNKGQSSSGRMRDNRFAISAITLNILFLILNMPIVIEDLIDVSSTSSHWFDFFAEFCYYTYYASGFYVQCLVNSEFRAKFIDMFVNRLSLGSSSNSQVKTAYTKPIYSVSNNNNLEVE